MMVETTNKRWALGLAAMGMATLLSGCQYFTLAPANEPVQVASSITVTPTIDWSRHTQDNIEMWTVDGPALQRLMFYINVEDGQPLTNKTVWLGEKVQPFDNDELPTYRAKMDVLEVSDLLRDTYDRFGYEQFTFTNVSPQTFGDNAGFRFDFTFVNKDGLEKQGLAQGAVVDDKLHIAVYTGARQHYFQSYQSAVEQMLSSLKFSQQG